MKEVTGIVRSIDNLGRVVIPIELRRTLNLEPGTPLELSLFGSYILLSCNCPENEEFLTLSSPLVQDTIHLFKALSVEDLLLASQFIQRLSGDSGKNRGHSL